MLWTKAKTHEPLYISVFLSVKMGIIPGRSWHCYCDWREYIEALSKVLLSKGLMVMKMGTKDIRV